MPIFKIYKYPHPILRKRCKKVERVGPWEKKVLSRMVETMYAAQGVGLAAPQVGVDRQMLVADSEGRLIKIVNPRILSQEGESVMEEGCLSLPEIMLKIKRAKKILIEGINEKGELVKVQAENLFAHILQHEIDHLQGRLIVDYISEREKKKITPKLKQLEENFKQPQSYPERKKGSFIAG